MGRYVEGGHDTLKIRFKSQSAADATISEDAMIMRDLNCIEVFWGEMDN